MVSLKEVESQLKKLGLNFRWWGRSEVKELCKVLSEGEVIKQCINGHYQGGFALLAATNQRLLLIDRKPMFLTIEAIWYDKIGQVDFNHRLLNATICISTPNKDLTFTTWNNMHLKNLMLYTQEKMTEAKSGESQIYDNSITSDSEPIEQVQPLSSYSTNPTLNQESYAANSTQQQPVLEYPSQEGMTTPPNTLAKNPYDVTLYAATRLPFSRRRYYARY